MKKSTLATALLLSVLSSQSMSSEVCSKVGELAAAVMHGRQEGVYASAIKNVVKNQEQSIKIIAEAAIDGAYKTTVFTTKARKMQAEVEFSNRWELLCISVEAKQ